MTLDTPTKDLISKYVRLKELGCNSYAIRIEDNLKSQGIEIVSIGKGVGSKKRIVLLKVNGVSVPSYVD